MGRQRERQQRSARRGGQPARRSAAGARALALAAHAGGGHCAVHESRAERHARRRRPVARALRREGGRVRARPHVRRAALPDPHADGARAGAQSRAPGAPAARARGRRRARRTPPRPARRRPAAPSGRQTTARTRTDAARRVDCSRLEAASAIQPRRE